MSLKGFQWLKNDEVIMSYLFKDKVLDVWLNITEQDYLDFKNYLEDHACNISKVEYHNKKK